MFSDVGDYTQAEAQALDEENKKLKAQLEAVKRLAKAQYKDTIIKFDCDQDALEFEHAFNACLALGIDPKEL
jgi:hypothetical protein